jgi:hypothetical protein
MMVSKEHKYYILPFRQKGRWEMKLPEISMVVGSLFGFCFLSGLDTPAAHADFTFGEAVNLGPTINSTGHDALPHISPDGRELYFASIRPGGYGETDIWMCKRADVEDPWGPPENPGPQVNTSLGEEPGSLSDDGLTMYLDVYSPGTSHNIYMTTRATTDAPWGPPVSLGPVVNSAQFDRSPVLSADGLELYFQSTRPGGYGDWDVWVSTRASPSDPWKTPVNLGPTINTPYRENPSWILPDGLTLLLTSTRPGGFGEQDAWMATRPSKDSPWGPPRNLGPSINTVWGEVVTSISRDGRWCYFFDYGILRPNGCGGPDLWQAPILPIVDFNADSKVDLTDLVMLIDNWGTDNALYDIGPMPWGDGQVDIEDLKVFVAEWEKQNPPAVDEGQ